MREYCLRFANLVFGLMIFALGTVVMIKANIGLAPWEAFHWGIANKTGLSFGLVVILVGAIILLASIAMKEKFGFGTIADVLLIGNFCNLYLKLSENIPMIENFWLGILVMLFGLFFISLGSYFYIHAAMGAGPRDALMIALKKRFPAVPVGVIRGSIEGTVLFLGWLMGAKVGIGTVLAVFGISFILQFTFNLFHFDVKSVKSESVAETIQNLVQLRNGSRS